MLYEQRPSLHYMKFEKKIINILLGTDESPNSPNPQSCPACPNVVSRGSPIDNRLSGHTMESMNMDYSDYCVWRKTKSLVCTLKSYIVDFEKVHCTPQQKAILFTPLFSYGQRSFL